MKKAIKAMPVSDYIEVMEKDPIKSKPSANKPGKPETERQHISIKVRKTDLKLLKQEAEKQGLKYQSLINSILHQYVHGHLKKT